MLLRHINITPAFIEYGHTEIQGCRTSPAAIHLIKNKIGNNKLIPQCFNKQILNYLFAVYTFTEKLNINSICMEPPPPTKPPRGIKYGKDEVYCFESSKKKENEIIESVKFALTLNSYTTFCIIHALLWYTKRHEDKVMTTPPQMWVRLYFVVLLKRPFYVNLNIVFYVHIVSRLWLSGQRHQVPGIQRDD